MNVMMNPIVESHLKDRYREGRMAQLVVISQELQHVKEGKEKTRGISRVRTWQGLGGAPPAVLNNFK